MVSLTGFPKSSVLRNLTPLLPFPTNYNRPFLCLQMFFSNSECEIANSITHPVASEWLTAHFLNKIKLVIRSPNRGTSTKTTLISFKRFRRQSSRSSCFCPRISRAALVRCVEILDTIVNGNEVVKSVANVAQLSLDKGTFCFPAGMLLSYFALNCVVRVRLIGGQLTRGQWFCWIF